MRKLNDLIYLSDIKTLFLFSDAEILYNKQPKERKKYPRKKDESKIKEENEEGEISFRKRKRKIRKGLAVLDTSETTTFSSSTSISTLASMSIDDITSLREAQELKIEYSNLAKGITKKVVNLKEKYGRDLKINEDGDVQVTYKDLLRINRTALLLNEKTLIYILYSALNICESRIQLGDLMRMTREGHISFYNFLQHIPEAHRERLSLTKGHSFAFNKTATIRSHMGKFVEVIPDLKSSFKTPDMKLLVQRYLKELSLPDELYDYIDRLINFLPPVMKFKNFLPNYEARAIAYIIFTLKVLFGIDGYREIEISRSAKKFNKKLADNGIDSKIFVYEEWREFIAYRDVILSKYFYPYILSPQYQGNKPYEKFLEMLDVVSPEKLDKKYKATHNVLDQKRDDKFLNSKNLATKLLAMHQNDFDIEQETNKFEFSLTPLHDAFNAIISRMGHKMKKKIIEVDHCQRSFELFLKPKSIFNLFDIKIQIKKCTFPQTYFFKKEDTRCKSVKKFRVIHDGYDVQEWKNEVKKAQKAKKEDSKAFTIQHHSRRIQTLLKKRLKIKRDIYNRKLQRYKSKIAKEPLEHNILDEFLSDSDNEPRKVSESDEIYDPALDELTASLKKIDNAHKYDYETNHRVFTFITPDFNLWHRNIPITDHKQEDFEEEFVELPKNFRWLLAACANVINQEEKDVYRQLLIIELEFIKNQEPIELQKVQPVSIAPQW